MSDLEVEPVESVDEAAVPAGVDAPEVVLYGGKGGVGKTTMAAATALASARDGTATLAISTDPAHSLSDALEREVPTEPGRIHDEYPLYGVEIDPDAAMEQSELFGEGANPLGGMGEVLGGMGGPGAGEAADDLGDLLGGGAMPGADEAAAVQLLLTHLDDERFDRVVVDTAPTGHTLRLLELPELLDSMVGRIAKIRQRMQGMFENLKGMFGGDDADLEAGQADLDAVKERIERLQALLTDPARTDFRIVMVPEEMSVVESRRLRDQLGEYGVPVGTVVVNRVMEDLADVAAGVEPGHVVTPNLDSCEFCQRRWDVQQGALAEAQELFRGTEVRRVPLFADEVRGEAMLELVAACLE
jgi:arsenite-transporting ATPase